MSSYKTQKRVFTKRNENDNFNILKITKKLFCFLSSTGNTISNEEFQTFLFDSGLLDDQILTKDYADFLFFATSCSRNDIDFDEFCQLIYKIIETKNPDDFILDECVTVRKFYDLYIIPFLNMMNNNNIKYASKRDNIYNFDYGYDCNNNENVNNFYKLNYKLLISKIANKENKDIIENNYLLFYKIYLKYFCFEDLNIASKQKNHLSLKAFLKVLEDFDIIPTYLNMKQVEYIYQKVIENRQFILIIFKNLINESICQNMGRWFCLYHFIVSLFLVSLCNIITKIPKCELNFIENDALAKIIKSLYRSKILEIIMPEEMQKLQIGLLDKKKDSDNFNLGDSLDESKESKDSLSPIRPKKTMNEIYSIKKSKSSNKLIYDNMKKCSDINPNTSLILRDIAPLVLSRYYTQLVTIYKYYSEMYFETIFSIYMTHNGFNKFIKDIGLLDTVSNKEEKIFIDNMPPFKKFMYLKEKSNKLEFSYINFIFSKFSSATFSPPSQNSQDQKPKSNKRLNFPNFIYIILCLSSKMFNPKFSSLSFSDKLFVFDDLVVEPIPAKYAYIFCDKFICPLYEKLKNVNILQIWNLWPSFVKDFSDFECLLTEGKLGTIVNKIMPLLKTIIKHYTNNKDTINYGQYCKLLSEFSIFPNLIQRKKMNQIFIGFIDNFEENYLLPGDNKIEMNINSCIKALIFIGVSINYPCQEQENLVNDRDTFLFNLSLNLLSFLQRMAQNKTLGKISLNSPNNKLQSKFLSAFLEVRQQVLEEGEEIEEEEEDLDELGNI